MIRQSVERCPCEFSPVERGRPRPHGGRRPAPTAHAGGDARAPFGKAARTRKRTGPPALHRAAATPSRLALVALFALILVAPHARAATPQAGAPAPSGVITGRVLLDTGEPAADVDVPVSSYDSEGGEPIGTGTDAAGNFTTPPLRPGSYNVTADYPGYVSEASATPRAARPGDTVTIRLVKGGVITGTVTDAEGKPVVAIFVRAWSTDTRGHSFYLNGVMTDDRGVYRIYGLSAGSYLVSAGGLRPYDDDVTEYAGAGPVYHPSSSRTQAAEVSVAAGQEVTSVDIRYRDEPAHAIAGTVAGGGTGDAYGSVLVHLVAPDGSVLGSSYAGRVGATSPFVFRGLADGEYDVVARAYERSADGAVATRHITVKGSDVENVRLELAALGSIAGRIDLAAEDASRPETCRTDGDRAIEGTLVSVQRVRPGPADPAGLETDGAFGPANARGAFAVRGLPRGTYRPRLDLPSDAWFVDAVTRPQPGKPPALVSDVALGPGQKLADLVVRVGRGAARATGTVAPPAGAPLAPDLIVYFVPADPALAENVWRYAEATVRRDGSFEAKRLAPGKYLLVARHAPKESEKSPVWDAAQRAALRAEASKVARPLEVAACERAAGVIVPGAKVP